MNKVKFICFGESVENLKLSYAYNVIGTPKEWNFKDKELVLFVVKVNNNWYVCGKANVIGKTDINPFEKYYTYLVEQLVACEPFEINEMCKKAMGQYWGLIFQRPRDIFNEEFCSFIETNFIEKPVDEMLNKLEEMKK